MKDLEILGFTICGLLEMNQRRRKQWCDLKIHRRFVTKTGHNSRDEKCETKSCVTMGQENKTHRNPVE